MDAEQLETVYFNFVDYYSKNLNFIPSLNHLEILSLISFYAERLSASNILNDEAFNKKILKIICYASQATNEFTLTKILEQMYLNYQTFKSFDEKLKYLKNIFGNYNVWYALCLIEEKDDFYKYKTQIGTIINKL